jgi:lysophospholipase
VEVSRPFCLCEPLIPPGSRRILILSSAANNFSSLAQLRVDGDLTTDSETGKSGNQTEYYLELFRNAGAKEEEGFSVSGADILGQFYRQYLPPAEHYGNVSDIAEPETAFSKGLGPMPLVLLSEVIPGESPEVHEIYYPAPNISTIYEIGPFEFGSWVGGRVQAFIPTKYLGTSMNEGHPTNSNVCVNGFDKINFLQGSTGNAWNLWLTFKFYGFNGFYKRNAIPIPDPNYGLVKTLEEVAKAFKITFNQTLWAHYPNPFVNYNKKMANVDELLIVCCPPV